MVKKIRLKKTLCAVLIGVLVFGITACGGSGGAGDTGNALKVGWTSEPDSLNPLTSYSTEAMQVFDIIYEPLVSYDAELQPEYRLAESYSYSEDFLIVTYKLREGVKWHDGEPFTADDVVGTYNIVKEYEMTDAAEYTKDLEEISAPDDYTVVMKFSKPQAFNLSPTIQILPMHIWGDLSDDEIQAEPNSAPIGTGPMMFADWQQGSTVTIKRNPEYYGEAPGPDSIIFIQYGNEDVMAQALKTGEIDIVAELSPTVWDGIQDEENIKAVSLPAFSFHMVGINCNEEPTSLGNPLLKDRVVRQALGYAMNRENIVEIALAGHGSPGSVLIPDAMKEWQYEVPEEELIDNNPDKAKEILEAAGYVDSNGDGVREKDGKDLEFRLMAIESTTVDVRAAQIFRDSAAEIGIKLVLTTMDENTMGDAIFDTEKTDYDLFVWGWDSDYLDPGYLLAIPLTSQIGNNNDVYYSNETYDNLYREQNSEMDPAARKTILDEMQKIFYEDSAYQILWYQDKLQAYRTDKWTGWVDTPGGVIYNVTYDNYLHVKPAS